MKKFMFFMLVVSIIIYIFGLFASNKLLYPKQEHDSMSITPEKYGLKYEDIHFISSDGLIIKGFFVPANKAKGTIIILHGYGNNKSDVLQYANFLNKNNYNSLLFDSRAHGQTKGKCTLGYLESRDLAGAVNYLLTRADVNKDKIGVLGLSMGAVTAIIGAAKNKLIKAVVAESGFPSFEREVTRETNLTYKLPKYPTVPITIWFAQWRAGFCVKDADAVKYVAQISPRPIFIIAGGNDLEIPPENQELLFKYAKEPKQIWIAPQSDHLEAHTMYPKEYESKVIDFFDRYLNNLTN